MAVDRKPAAAARPGDDHDTAKDEDEKIASGSVVREKDSGGAEEPMPAGSSVTPANDEEYLDEEGRPLSDYEILRLERMKRNREKLAQLGLAQNHHDKDGVWGVGATNSDAKKNKPARPRKSETTAALPLRAKSSRTSKKSVNYAEPSISVRTLLKKAEAKEDEGEVPEEEAITEQEPSAVNNPSEDAAAQVPERKRKWDQERLPQDIYREFKRIRSYKRDLLIEAQRAARNADKEIRYWTKRVEKYQKTFLRKKNETDEKLALGGKTSRELLQILDEKMPEIQEAVRNYEEFLYADQREQQRAVKQKEAEEKMKLLDALVRFPKALKVRDIVNVVIGVLSSCYDIIVH
jgi:hypothetical protein